MHSRWISAMKWQNLVGWLPRTISELTLPSFTHMIATCVEQSASILLCNSKTGRMWWEGVCMLRNHWGIIAGMLYVAYSLINDIMHEVYTIAVLHDPGPWEHEIRGDTAQDRGKSGQHALMQRVRLRSGSETSIKMAPRGKLYVTRGGPNTDGASNAGFFDHLSKVPRLLLHVLHEHGCTSHHYFIM